MLPVPTILIVAIAGVFAMFVVSMISGSIMPPILILMLAGILFYVLHQIGVFKIDTKDGEIDISFQETASSPPPLLNTKQTMKPLSIEKKEVFYISGNNYTYDEAPAVCAAYESELASYDQIMQAYSNGAEWCGYGWSQGGMGLYPTQQSTWESLQQESGQSKRTGCGRPGVNGGYFDTNSKFGVNCYGVKPGNKNITLPLPLPGTDAGEFNKMVQKFKSMLSSIIVSPFNRNAWSEITSPINTNGLLSANAHKS
jgi:hypothetical protein